MVVNIWCGPAILTSISKKKKKINIKMCTKFFFFLCGKCLPIFPLKSDTNRKLTLNETKKKKQLDILMFTKWISS